MRVVIIGPTWPYRGGIAQYAAALAQHLARHHEVTLISFARQYPRWLFPGRTDRDPSDRVHEGQVEYVLDPLRPWTWWQAARRIARLRPDVVLAQWWVPFWAPSLAAVLTLARRWWPCRVVIECHNVLPHEGGGWLDRALTRLALDRADAFIVHGAADAQALDDLGVRPNAPRHRVTMPPATLPAAPERGQARARLGLPPTAPVALFFGFVRTYKGLDHLLAALPAVLKQVPELRLVVAGEFWASAADFQLRARQLGVAEAVVLHDRYVPNDEVAVLFGAADVVVLPYVTASQSAVVPLAVRYGVPVVASRVGGLPEVVEDGSSGLLVPPADPAALASALLRVFTEPGLLAHLQLGTVALGGRFSWDAVVRTVELAATASDGDRRVPA